MTLAFNWIDYTILIIVFFSLIIGLLHGFVREIIALVSWLVAFLVAAVFSPKLAEFFASHASSAADASAPQVSLTTLGISFACLFIAVLLIGKLINFILGFVVPGTGIGLVNRFLGGVFGLIRGCIIVISLLFLVEFTPFASHSAFQESQLMPHLQPVVKWLSDTLQPQFQEIKAKMEQTISALTTPAASHQP